MTREEIEATLRRVAVHIENRAIGSIAERQDFERTVVGLHLPMVLKLVSKAYEEAAHRQCPHCANGLPLTFAEDWRVSNTFGEGNQVRGWLHEESGGYLTCQAGGIRALADSISREGEK